MDDHKQAKTRTAKDMAASMTPNLSKEVRMSEDRGVTNPSFPSESRTDLLKAQLVKLLKLEEQLHGQGDVANDLMAFDLETEELIQRLYGADQLGRLETYKYATIGEAETMVNLPEAAQEDLAVDLPRKGMQQRRQVFLGLISELSDAESQEVDALTGEDHEDPPGMS